MVSVPYSLPPLLADRWEARRWPVSLLRRHLLRLVLCLPFVALAIWADAQGVFSAVNASIARDAQSFAFGSTGLGFLTHAYPPIPVALAKVVPGAPGSLAIVGALCAGGLLQLCWERLLRAQVPGWLAAMLLLGLAGAPVFWLTTTENLPGFLGLACFAVAMAGMLDFLFSARTTGGFVAGLSIGLAVMCDPSSIVYAASLLLAAPFLAWERFHDEPYAMRSTLAVLAFPAVAVMAAWVFLQWRFTGSVWHPLAMAPDAFRFPYGVLDGLSRSASLVGWQLLCSPVFLISAVLVLWRRPIAFCAFLIVPLDLVVAGWLGLLVSTAQGLVLLSLLGVLAVPTWPGRLPSVLLAVAVPVGMVASLFVANGFGVWPYLRAIGL